MLDYSLSRFASVSSKRPVRHDFCIVSIWARNTHGTGGVITSFEASTSRHGRERLGALRIRVHFV